MPPLSEAQLRALVASVRARTAEARFIGVQAGAWQGAPRLRVAGEEIEVVSCPSELALREALASRADAGGRVVLLCDFPGHTLSHDVAARLARAQLLHVRPWRSVVELFRAREIDPRLAGEGWIAERLLELAPAEGYPAVASGVLDADTVWEILLRRMLGLGVPRPDAEALLRWTLEDGACGRFAEAAPEARAAMRGWLARTAGGVGEAILAAVEAGRGPDALALGLVSRVLFSEGWEREPELIQARTRVEPALGGRALAAPHGLAWADAAERIVRRQLEAGERHALEPWLKRADELLQELGAHAFAYRSPVLLTGLQQRLTLYGRALRAVVEGSGETLESLEAAAAVVRAHLVAAVSPPRMRALDMSLRLARALPLRASAPKARSFAEAATSYLADGSFLDRAREALWEGDGNPAVSEAYALLREAHAAHRESESRRFAELLADWLRHGSPAPELLPLERVLGETVAPLAAALPVLLLVMDGMSPAVYRELAEDLANEGWVEIGPEAGPPRRAGIAVLPTLTECSRTSLLCGALRTGTQATEKTAFAAHPALVAASRAGSPPVLFHKGELVDPAEPGLAPAVRRALEKPAQRVVGVVLNAVDDFLGKSDQLRPRWGVHGIRPLDALLEAARAAGRAVVLTSDHGHVLERGLEVRRVDASAARFRPAEGAAGEGEVLLEGERVLAAGQRVLALWSEHVRFGAKQNGYHGGASPQEVVVPVAAFVPYGARVTGWPELPLELPAWWREAPPPAVAPAPEPVRATPARGQTGLLFPPPSVAPAAPAAPAAPTEPAWLGALFASPVYATQRERVQRAGVDDAVVRRVLVALEARGGKLTLDALAQSLAMPTYRCKALLAAVRAVLNVDDYTILELDESSNTVELQRELLRVQFALDTGE